jgi:hypothetical protein
MNPGNKTSRKYAWQTVIIQYTKGIPQRKYMLELQ